MAIGFIGLGIMGEGMAARLVSEGVAGTAEVPLVVWNRTASKCTGIVCLLYGLQLLQTCIYPLPLQSTFVLTSTNRSYFIISPVKHTTSRSKREVLG